MTVFLVLVVIIVYKYYQQKKENPLNEQREKLSVQSALKLKEEFEKQCRFNAKVDELLEDIQKKVEFIESDHTPELQKANSVLLEELQTIAQLPMTTVEELKYALFRFNEGSFRTPEELEWYQKRREGLKLLKSGKFKKQCFIISTVSFFVPFLGFAAFLFFEVFDGIQGDMFLTIPISLFFGLFAGFIGIVLGHSINIERAERYQMPEHHPDVKNEINKQHISGFALLGVTTSLLSNSKKYIKNISNPNKWEKKCEQKK